MMRRISVGVGVLALTAVLLMSVAGIALAERPDRYVIPKVPEHLQVDGWGCGGAAMAMLMDYWGPEVPYFAVVNVIRSTGRGSSLMDAARAGQFSESSFAAAGANYPGYLCCNEVGGYDERKLGYGAFYFASTEPWFDQLRDIVAQGYPVQVLNDWLPDEYGPHYRVVTGYDDVKQEIYLQEPYPYGGWLDEYRLAGSPYWTWPYEDFLAVWALPTDRWGVMGKNYGAVVAAPWNVKVAMPRTVAKGGVVTATVSATYRCPEPFGDPGFPTFPASDAQLTVRLPAGWTVAEGSNVIPFDGEELLAGETKTVTVKIKANRRRGISKLTFTASGVITGSAPEWGTMWWNIPYDYTDVIGGTKVVALRVR